MPDWQEIWPEERPRWGTYRRRFTGSLLAATWPCGVADSATGNVVPQDPLDAA